jgi:magnesium chelatase subunit I
VLTALKNIQGLFDKVGRLSIAPKDSPELQVSAAEFILEGLYAHKKIGRSEERVFTAGEKPPIRAEKQFEREEPRTRQRRPYN